MSPERPWLGDTGKYSPNNANVYTVVALSHLSCRDGARSQPEDRAMPEVISERSSLVRTLSPRGYHIKKTPSFEGVFFIQVSNDSLKVSTKPGEVH